MIKLGKILFGVSALFLANGMMAQSKLDAKQGLDVNKQLQYCHTQVGRALEELKQKGWNCRKATPEEWCDGFWPGILWMDYQNTRDEAVRKAAEGYTESLKDIAYRPCYDHDIGFLMFCSYGKGYEVNHSQDYKRPR